MKRPLSVALSILLIIQIFLLTGCGDKAENNFGKSDFNYSTDMQYIYHMMGANAPMTKSDTGYYYVGDDGIVIYIDKESEKATPLCSKPNCMHDDPDTCDAYFNISENIIIDSALGSHDGTALQYYDGSLYMVCGEYGEREENKIKYQTYLIKTAPDGTNRQKIIDNFKFRFVNWFIHRGYFYCSTDSQVLRIPLDSPKSDPEIIYEVNEDSGYNLGTFNLMCAYDNYLYFLIQDEMKSVCVNLDTLEKTILEDNNGGLKLCIAFMGNKLITSYNVDGDVIYEKSDLDGENAEYFYTEEDNEPGIAYTDGEYFYGDNNFLVSKGEEDKQTITVFDMNMNVIDTFTLPESEGSVCNFVNAQDDDYFILEALNKNGERCVVMADKSQIGSINGKQIEYTELCKLDWYDKEANAPYVYAD